MLFIHSYFQKFQVKCLALDKSCIMESDDDMIVLVVIDEDDKENTSKIKKEPDFSGNALGLDSILEIAQKYGQFIPIKEEPYYSDDPDEKLLDGIKSEPGDDYSECLDNSHDNTVNDDNVSDAEECIKSDISCKPQNPDKHRSSMLKPSQRKSFVNELRQQYRELRENENLLIDTIEQVMRSVKPPPLPRDYYITNGIKLECITCGHMSDSISTASRHYQDKHGQRYLVCYACGVDFRSLTNLYKHEKRCVAPDARVVLKARAAFVGFKGRSRPYLQPGRPPPRKKGARYPCQRCTAVFLTRTNLISHENLHRGERPYRCHACPSAYTSFSALARHEKQHMDIQFICDYCGRTFKIKTALVSHMNTHNPIRKHGCEECDRRFAQKSALLLHVNRVHRNLPPPCACQICPKRFPRMSLLKAHMKKEHGMTILTRKMFFKSLPTMTDLEVKESKVIFKTEDELIANEAPASQNIQKEEDEEMDNHYFGEEEEAPVSKNIMKNFMEYVRNSSQDLDGKVLQGYDNDVNSFLLHVEAMVEGSEVMETTNKK